MPSDRASGGLKRRRSALTRAFALVAILGFGLATAPSSTESAIANGDTRTLVFSNSHTNESGSFTYMVDGVYDQPTLAKLNWLLRDWRLNESTKMDPKLFDIVWEVYRESGSTQPIDVLSGYRSPHTNAMLRRRSRQVAKYSQHMEGKAIDAHFVDVDTATIRDIAMRMQDGGVGFYPSGITPWVHIDSGDVRYWPRMSRAALARLFPDGKTVFVPADGQPMPGYEQARAEIEARGGEVQVASANAAKPNFFAWLFGDRGGGVDDAEEADGAEAAPPPGRGGAKPPSILANATPAPRPTPKPEVVASADSATKSDASPAAATDDAAADEFIAPLPPRKPADILAAQLAPFDAPTPPPRPAEFAIAALADAAADESELIAALIKRGRLPGAITRGLGGAPPEALALAEPAAAPEPPERTAALARAAQLAASLPPLPPARRMAAPPAAVASPAADGLSTATRTSAAAASAAAIPAPAAPNAAFRAVSLLTAPDLWRDSPNPYGGLVYDAFTPGAPPPRAGGLAALRGSMP